MAKEPRRHQSAHELKGEIARSRDRLVREVRGVRSEMNLGRKVRRSFRKNPAIWVGVAVAAGALLVVLPRRRKVYVDLASGAKAKPRSKLLETGFLLGAFRVAAMLLRPMVTRFVMKKMREHGRYPDGILKW